ncbi:hypothetical protein IMC75_04755 [Campylobacter peloridis]|uniref:Uncharacterized protein n=1 Tax=Campylobacter peloridis TaxID=488546 RepID=A0ABX6TQW0_9BACT|nr:DUF6270 domain-containing protein [Campylobacter peloridis]AJC84185.1 hypothetical protein CPEL_0317 [Campylobacter peloridis LMG 23910]QOQ88286.1 hypothetical protein IMC75_04755 [Campylobacter peloridis]
MNKTIKVFILGSCPSKDPFELADKKDFQIVGYIARTSFASFTSKPYVDQKIIKNILSPYHQKMVLNDMSKTTFKKILNSDFDVLLIDLIDERLNLSVFNEYIHTLSNEYKKALYKPNQYQIVKQFSEKKMSLWKKGFKKFIDFIKTNSLEDKIFLNKFYWTIKVGEESILNKNYTQEFIDKVNTDLDKMYNYFIKNLPNTKVIEYPKSIIYSDPQHKWGLEAFHYNKLMFKWQLDYISLLKNKEIAYIEKNNKKMYYKFTLSKRKDAPLLVIFHGHTFNSKPSNYKNEFYHILCPIDNFGVENCGSWWLGENGIFFVKELLHQLILSIKQKHNIKKMVFWGSSMGGYGAILHGILLKADVVFANIPQIKLLGSTYSNSGMIKYFQPIFGNNISIYNDLTNLLDKKKPECNPLFFIIQSRFDYKGYLEEQGKYFFETCLKNNINISLEVVPLKGHRLFYSIDESIKKIERFLHEIK